MQKIFFLSFLFCAVSISSCRCENIRTPVVAGSFYPSQPAELTATINSYLKSVPPSKLSDSPIGFIIPHAGYIYSGPVAAYAYAVIKNLSVDTVLIIGLAHQYPVNGGALYAEGSFATPLGSIPINTAVCKELMQTSSLIQNIPEAHLQEHSIEVQLPFLQTFFSNFSLVPLLMGSPSLATCENIGNAIASVAKKYPLLIIASTDMSHFPSYTDALKVDAAAIEALKKMDPVKLKETVDREMHKGIPELSCVFCGEGAVYTTMYACKQLGADAVTILKYANSGDTAGTKDRVVGYLSAVFTKKQGGSPMHDEFSIKPENQKVLLQVARKSISTFLSEKKLPLVSAREDDELAQNAAVFVTLTKHGNLRGCIGTTEARYPLIDAVNQLAVSAAFQDYRFPQVTADELPDIRIEISVLSPLKKIVNHKEIEPNVHGVVVEKGGRSGLFLPQVWEHFPDDKEGFMGELCSQKAGLNRDAWKKDKNVNLYVFTVFAFEEPKK